MHNAGHKLDKENQGSGLAIMNENDIDKKVGEGKSLLVAQDWKHINEFSFWSFEDDHPKCINDFEYLRPRRCYHWNGTYWRGILPDHPLPTECG